MLREPFVVVVESAELLEQKPTLDPGKGDDCLAKAMIAHWIHLTRPQRRLPSANCYLSKLPCQSGHPRSSAEKATKAATPRGLRSGGGQKGGGGGGERGGEERERKRDEKERE